MATGKTAGAGGGLETATETFFGLGIRSGCLLIACPSGLPGMAGVRTFKLRRWPSGGETAAAGCQPMMDGSTTGAAHRGQVVVPPPVARDISSRAAHWGQGSWKRQSGGKTGIQTVLCNYHYFSNYRKVILQITPILEGHEYSGCLNNKL
jgi:hypothetical protein